jgi:Esterase/lipase
MIPSVLPSQKDTSVLRLPFVAVAYLDPGHRQDHNWSYRQAITNNALKVSLRLFTLLRMRPSLSLKPRLEGKRFVLVEPAKPELYTGVAVDEEIKPETIGGTWYPRRFSSDIVTPEDQYIVLHFHGGSFILGDGRIASCGFLAKNFLSHTPSAYVFSIQYRLAGDPKGRFPAQLQDAISAYSYLINTLHIPASRIVLSGDSCGGDLVLGLLRYIVQYSCPSSLPTPKCSWIFSPWCNVLHGKDTDAWVNSANYKTECIPASFPAWGAKHFLGDVEITESVEQYVAPIRHPFILPSPVLIVSGGREVLCPDHRELTKVFGEVPQNSGSVELYVEESVPHDVLMVGWIFGFRKEARRCSEKAGEFVRGLHSFTKEA